MSKLEKILWVADGWLQMVADIPPTFHTAVILCHGLTGDRSGPQRILTEWAAILCQHGYLCVRFDFRGSGDSSGAFANTTIEQMYLDLRAVIDWCYKEFAFQTLVLGGLSLGGLVALKTMPLYTDCKGLFLFSSDIQDFPKFDLSEDPLSIRDGQFYLHKIFFEERLALKPGHILSSSPKRCFLIYGQHDEKISRMAQQLKENQAPITVHCVENSGHLFESLAARYRAINIMIDELKCLSPLCPAP